MHAGYLHLQNTFKYTVQTMFQKPSGCQGVQIPDLSPHHMQRIREPATDGKSEKSVQQIEAK